MELNNVSVILNERIVLKSITFTWEVGESIAIIGANGAGKTTLLKAISLLVKPNSGNVKLPYDKAKEWKKGIGIVFPDSFLYDDLTAYENLRFYQKLYGGRDTKKIIDLLEAVQLLSVKDEFVGSFSKGMKQRLSIARALIHDPKYLILDEPFDGLDLNSKKILENLLLKKKEQGIGWLLVSHDLEHAWKVCNQVTLMNKGRIVHRERCLEEFYDDFLFRYNELLKGESQ